MLRPVLLLIASWSCDAFVAPAGRAFLGSRALSAASSRMSGQPAALRPGAAIAASQRAFVALDAWSGSSRGACAGGSSEGGSCEGGSFGGGGSGGSWWRRHNLGGASDSGGDGHSGERCRRAMQGLVAMRGAESWLSAEAGRSSRMRCPAVNALLCINVAVYLLQVLSQGWLLTAGAKLNPMIVSGQYYRVSR